MPYKNLADQKAFQVRYRKRNAQQKMDTAKRYVAAGKCFMCKKPNTTNRGKYRCAACTEKQMKTGRIYYLKNKKRINEYNKLRTRNMRAWIDSYKTKCLYCEETHIACLDFHHRNPKSKKFDIGLWSSNSCDKKVILREIEKCDVLCTNCHRKLHWREKHP